MTDDDAGKGAVFLVLDGAEEVVRSNVVKLHDAPPALPPPPPDDDDGGDDGDDGRRKRNRYGLPEGCPIIPLGLGGDMYFYIDTVGQYRELEDGKHSRLKIQGLFNKRAGMLFDLWPRKDKDGNTVGWRPEAVAMDLMVACGRIGVFDPFNKLRGLGAWRGDDGDLVLHCGDEIMIGGEWRAPGFHNGRVYPLGKAILRPSALAAPSGPDGPGAALMALLRTWNWKRRELDPHLLMGWIAAAMIGGALKWRPVVWITGGPGTGKSTLQNDLITALFDDALVSVDDATPASIRDAAKYSTTPVAIDEAEPGEEGGRRIDAMVRLARSAATGSITMRSSADNTAKHFIVRNCFLFSSVLVAGLQPADRSRIAILELGDLSNKAPPKFGSAAMKELGGAILRRLLDQWDRWPQALEAYRAAIMGCGHDARAADVFGTMLAAADLVLHDGLVLDEAAMEWADKLGAADAQEGSENLRDEEACNRHLVTTVLPFDGIGTRQTIAKWATVAAVEPIGDKRDEAIRVLGNSGLRMIKEGHGETAEWFLAVANDHQGLSRIFNGTKWAARSGAPGVWVQALRRLTLCKPAGKMIRVGGTPLRTTLVHGAHVLDTEHDPVGGKQFDYE